MHTSLSAATHSDRHTLRFTHNRTHTHIYTSIKRISKETTQRRSRFLGSRTIRRRTIRRGQFVAKYKINFIERTVSIPATLFSSIPLPYQLHFLSLPLPFQLQFFITTDSTSETFLSLIPLPFLQHYYHHFRFHFCNIIFITSASISATLLSSLPLPQAIFINLASISATLSCLRYTCFRIL